VDNWYPDGHSTIDELDASVAARAVTTAAVVGCDRPCDASFAARRSTRCVAITHRLFVCLRIGKPDVRGPMTRRDSRRRRRAAGQLAAHFSSLGDDPFSELQLFANARTLNELDEVLRAEVIAEVERLLAAVADYDAFDLVELMRLREFPIAPVAGLDSGYDGNAAALELIALVLITRSLRNPRGLPREDGQPHEVIDELHERACRLLRLSSFWKQFAAQLRGDTPLARIAALYQSYFVGVRRLQYDSVEETLDRDLFDRPEIDALLSKHLGFTYAQFANVKDGIQSLYSSRLTELRDVTGEVVMSAKKDGREPTAEEVDSFRRAMIDFLFLPGQRAAFTAAEVSDIAGVEIKTVERILDAFAIQFGKLRSADDIVMSFLRGRNPLARTCLLKSGADFLQITGPIGSDSFRSIAETALKQDKKSWERYVRTRTAVSEAATVDALERLLGTPVQHVNLKYWAPTSEGRPEALSKNCPVPKRAGELVESDAVFRVGDVAVCVEVKGRTIADAARRGDLARLETEIEDTIGSGTLQAQRLERLIRTNGGIWRADSTWLELGDVREIRSIVVGLDYFGPLSVGLGDLQDTTLLGDGRPPWIVSIHDLIVVARVVERPAEFLLYLRRRTDSGVAQHFRSMDELDMFMLFMEGGLYVAPDPDDVRRAHPRTPPAKRKSKQDHLRDARPTFVGTHTDPLDKWMYWVEGTSPFEAEKPAFNAPPAMVELVDFLAADRKPGWLRFGADLLGLSGEAQSQLVRHVGELVLRTRDDGKFHTLVQGYAGLWGYPTFFAAAYSDVLGADDAADRLHTYMTAKKHQVRSDRSLGVLVNEHGSKTAVVYLNDAPTEDEHLDALGVSIGLDAKWAEPRKPPTNTARREQNRRTRARRR
jgi:hypothetical protein